jgi:tetratricopeptide (TPR) repeat protein
MITRSLLVALVVLGAATGSAHAADKRAAAVHFQHGRTLFEAGSFAAALEEFDAGYDAYPLPGFLVNIGQCQRKLDRLDDAAASFQKFLDSSSGDPRLRTEVQDALDEIGGERARRQAVEDEARRQRDLAERRHILDDEAPPPRAAVVTTAPALRSVPAAALLATPPVTSLDAPPKKGHRWVWAVVGVLAAGAVASAAAVAYIETRPQTPQAGSLGLLDGRR